MSSNNYAGDNPRGGRGGYIRGQGRGGYRGRGGAPDNQEGNYHQAGYSGGYSGGRGGRGQQQYQGYQQQQQQQPNIQTQVGVDPALISSSASANQKYQKKDQNQQQVSQQDQIDEMNRMVEQQNQQVDTSNLTAEQKFNMMLTGQLFDSAPSTNQAQSQQQNQRKYSDPYAESDDAIIVPKTQKVVQIQPSKPKQPRKRLNKDLMVTKFYKLEEVNLARFEKDVLNWIEIFSTTAQLPEVQEPLEVPADGVTLQSQPTKRPPIKNQGAGGYQQRQGGPGQSQWRGGDRRVPMQSLEEEENEEDPEWVDFDPKVQTGTFFGRSIQNEDQLRENVKNEKERQKKLFGERKTLQQLQEDEFEKLVREEQANAARQADLLDQELEKQVEEVAKDIEKNERNYSDIDLIYEKNSKQQQKRVQQQTLDDDQLEDLFNTLMHEEEKKIQSKTVQSTQDQSQGTQNASNQQTQAQQQQQTQPQQPQVQLPQQLMEQIKNLTIQQKEKLQTQKIVSLVRPKFTALQNVQNLFQNLPVVTHEKHRIKMQAIADMEEGENQEQSGQLFKQLMASINPFSKFIIEENLQQGQDLSVKNWQLEDSIFQKPVEQVRPENLQKTSSEMFCIYKYFSDPLMKVKSNTYTEDKFVQFKDLFPGQNLLETSPLNLQLQNMHPQVLMNLHNQQQNMAANLKNSSEFVPMRKQSAQPNENAQQSTDSTDPRQLQKASSAYNGQELESLEDGEDDQNEVEQKVPPKDLNSMESQLKSMLGFNPK
eukprot:403361538